VNDRYKIGVAISTHNRYETFKNSYDKIKELLPQGAKLIVVDDASDVPVPEADFRFDRNVGIARTKNKCLELLDDCDHIFLFDDDTYPQKEDWWKPYVENPEPHLCYIFPRLVNKDLGDCVELYRDDKNVAYSHARGCMLYIERRVLDVVGGMDTRYRRWGFEHVDYSNRIHNAGLTSFRYADVIGSSELFYSGDEEETVGTSVPIAERRTYLSEMRAHFEKSFNSTEFCAYKPKVKSKSEGTNNLVLTVYFTGQPDPQRNRNWTASEEEIEALKNSLESHNAKSVVLNDCFNDTLPIAGLMQTARVQTGLNPYFQRWLSYYQYLRAHPEIDNVWCVDATDVIMLRDPFADMDEDTLYIGSEPAKLVNDWLWNNHSIPFLIRFFRINREKTMLNAGLVGGSRELVMQFCLDMVTLFFDHKKELGVGDMGALQYVAYGKYKDKLSFGDHVNTEFKKYTDNGIAWWQHK